MGMKSKYFWISRDKSGTGQMNIDLYKMKLDNDGFYRTRLERGRGDFELQDNEACDRLLRTLGVKLKRGQQIRATLAQW